jgi:hypothetical protein
VARSKTTGGSAGAAEETANTGFPLFEHHARQATTTSTLSAPAALRVTAQAEAVAPVVIRSSTRTTAGGDAAEANAPRTFIARSRADNVV